MGISNYPYFSKIFHYEPSFLGIAYLWNPPYNNGNFRTLKLRHSTMKFRLYIYISIYILVGTSNLGP